MKVMTNMKKRISKNESKQQKKRKKDRKHEKFQTTTNPTAAPAEQPRCSPNVEYMAETELAESIRAASINVYRCVDVGLSVSCVCLCNTQCV